MKSDSNVLFFFANNQENYSFTSIRSDNNLVAVKSLGYFNHETRFSQAFPMKGQCRRAREHVKEITFYSCRLIGRLKFAASTSGSARHQIERAIYRCAGTLYATLVSLSETDDWPYLVGRPRGRSERVVSAAIFVETPLNGARSSQLHVRAA